MLAGVDGLIVLEKQCLGAETSLRTVLDVRKDSGVSFEFEDGGGPGGMLTPTHELAGAFPVLCQH